MLASRQTRVIGFWCLLIGAGMGCRPSNPEPPERRVRIEGEAVVGQLGPGAVRLEWSSGTFWAQAAPALARLRDAQAAVRLGEFPIRLRDESELTTWLDALGPGKLRLVFRADGVEIQTAVGKILGPDPNGPTLPSRAGRIDAQGLRAALQKLHARFGDDDGIWIIPSFGMPLDAISELVGVLESRSEERLFPYTALVFPRPANPGRR